MCIFFTQKDLPALQKTEILHEKWQKKVPKRASSPAKTEVLHEKKKFFLLKNTTQRRKKHNFCIKKWHWQNIDPKKQIPSQETWSFVWNNENRPTYGDFEKKIPTPNFTKFLNP